MSESALIVEVPEAEAYVGSLRRRFDPTAALGVPAHVTILSPFMDVVGATADVVATVERVLHHTRSFAFELEHAAPWPTVAYLTARPRDVFNAMTNAIANAFLKHPPYGGAHEELTPHLTFAAGDEETLASANDEIASELARLGPLRGVCGEVTWIENSTGVWKPFHRISLPS